MQSLNMNLYETKSDLNKNLEILQVKEVSQKVNLKLLPPTFDEGKISVCITSALLVNRHCYELK